MSEMFDVPMPHIFLILAFHIFLILAILRVGHSLLAKRTRTQAASIVTTPQAPRDYSTATCPYKRGDPGCNCEATNQRCICEIKHRRRAAGETATRPDSAARLGHSLLARRTHAPRVRVVDLTAEQLDYAAREAFNEAARQTDKSSYLTGIKDHRYEQ